MKFKIDENLPIDIAQFFRENGYDAMTILEQQMGGNPDAIVSQVCQEEDRTLITLDLDFADIRTYPPTDYPGIIVLRFARQDKLYLLAQIPNLIDLLQKEPIDRKLWIVNEKQVRIRE
jgi:predicted nuclease of predicted toxin-antitoxin system